MKGIDVSRWQGSIDWNKVKADGIEFVFVKATEGYGYVDPNFEQNVRGAYNAGLDVGAYHFARFESVNDAINEAKHFVNTVKDKPLNLPLVLDLETNEHGLSYAELTKAAETFLNYVRESTQFPVMVYTNKSFLSKFQKPSGVLLWYARYGVAKPDVDCDYWQYTDKGKVNGINGYVDMNLLMRSEHPAKVVKPTQKVEAVRQSKPQAKPTGDIYIVRSGDTLSEIAKKFNTTVSELVKFNNIKDPNKIYVGQKLRIRGSATVKSSPQYYVVQRGDTLSEIAVKFKTTVKKLQRLNGIKDPNKIYAGQKLRVK
ncbi:spore coat assembly SafA domain protein [Geobacillus kaustophilus]|uniref:Lysozyme n=1 Tax=Geobacillus kaustophilus TaxID=1462 RepID=A0A0D8BQK2_GEOKU|nr:GH25 family lysozyme [Geobacillus kaustophilus]KJE26431.1 spore coat assembly SafA domain protein [Geobacillus kaustophilus]